MGLPQARRRRGEYCFGIWLIMHTRAGYSIVFFIQNLGQHFNERGIRSNLGGSGRGNLVPVEDLFASGDEFKKSLSPGPSVMPAAHCLSAEVGSVQYLLFDGDGLTEQVWMVLGETDPFCFTLVEAEVAAGSGAPFVVLRWQADAGVLEDPHDCVVVDAVLDEREPGLDVGFGGDVALACSIRRRGSPHVGDRRGSRRPTPRWA